MPAISHLVQLASRSEPIIDPPLNGSSFALDSLGVAGFFGGDGAVAGMATVHLFALRRWCGWYNAPGSYEIAKQYGQLANSRFWDGLFPGPKRDPAELFGLDGQVGPPFLAARSGSNIPRTGHLAYLLARRARDTPTANNVKGRRTTPASVTVIDLPHAPPSVLRPQRIRGRAWLFAAVPIAASVAAVVLCALAQDWWCFVSIAFGMIAGGVASVVIGAGKLTFEHHTPARGAPPGDGVLLERDGGVIVLRGDEAAVSSLTRGRFVLEYAGAPAYGAIGHCSVLLTAQFLVQLLLIPQGTLFGQLMFVASIMISWAYNTYLSSLDKEDVQMDILLEDVLPIARNDLRKFTLGSRTAMAVFACLSLQPEAPIGNPLKLLNELIPNDTTVWQQWKAVVAHKLSTKQGLKFSEGDWKLTTLSQEERELLQMLFEDAEEAYHGWFVAFDRSSRSISKTPVPS